MTLYADSSYPVREDIESVHEKQLEQFGAPGTWGTGAQRLAIAAEARNAGIEASLLQAPEKALAVSDVQLPEIARRVVQRLAVSPKDVDEALYDEARAGGLSDAEYVEIVGLVARITDLDIFARGIGVPLRPLPPAQPGEPTRERPEAAVQEEAWAPTIPNPPEGGDEAAELYDGQPKPFIIRGMSLVPDEVRLHLEMEEVQYLPLRHIMEPNYQHHDGLSRAQAEVVAGRISALNECFY